MFGMDARGKVFGLQRFHLRAHGIFAAARGSFAQASDELLESDLLAGVRLDLSGAILKMRVELKGFCAQTRYALPMRTHARLDLLSLLLGMGDFPSEHAHARCNLRFLFAVERDAIFCAVQFQGGLIQQIVKLAQFALDRKSVV